MTLADTSVWIDYLRGAPGPASDWLRSNIGGDAAVTEPVVMELLAGARPGRQADRIERMVSSQTWHRFDSGTDFRAAVEVYWRARATGHQVRALSDCLIAAVALRLDVAVAHRDADFEYIAAATGLRTVDLR